MDYTWNALLSNMVPRACSGGVLPGSSEKNSLLHHFVLTHKCKHVGSYSGITVTQTGNGYTNNPAPQRVFCVCPLDQSWDKATSPEVNLMWLVQFWINFRPKGRSRKKCQLLFPEHNPLEHMIIYSDVSLPGIRVHLHTLYESRVTFQTSYVNLFDMCNIQNVPVLCWIFWAKFWHSPIGVILDWQEYYWEQNLAS